MRKVVAVGSAAMLMATMMLATVGVSTAGASTGPADDRQLTKPIGWWPFSGYTAGDVTTNLSAHAARLTDLHFDPGTSTFSGTMVANSGAYATASWWWYVDLTEAEVNADLAANGARPISLEAYATVNGTRFVVVMVANSGANAKASWWYHGTPSFITTQLAANHARLISLSPYPGGGLTAVMVDNTSTNAVSWWWYTNQTTSAINGYLATNKARLVDLSRTATGTWDAVMYKAPSTLRWTWLRGLTPAAAETMVRQLGERIIDVTPYQQSGPKVAVLTVSNLDAASTTLWNVIGPKVTGGSYGFYLKDAVAGTTLASLLEQQAFEPAGTMALLYHAKSINAESLGNALDTNLITYHYNAAAASDGHICPDSYATTTTTNLKNGNTLMMQSGDYRMARGILEKYSNAAITSYAKGLGMTKTVTNTNLGCFGTANTTTLLDLSRIYKAFQNGTVTANATWQAQFRSRMLNEGNDGPTYHALICPVVTQEATALGLSGTTATDFCNALTWISKDGFYQYAASLPSTVSLSSASLTGVPYKVNGTITPRYLSFGEFVDGDLIDSSAELTAVNDARGTLYAEAMRPYIRAALQTWP